jgi:flagellar protein FlaG
MDVQAAATATIYPPTVTQSVSPASSPSIAAASAASATAPSVTAPGSATADNSGSENASTQSNAGSSLGAAIGPTPGLATLPAGPPDGSKKGSHSDSTLASGVASLYNVQESNISVSFQIEQDPNEIVTVFTDKQTGKVIVQFPSETMIALAKFFDKLDGSVVNKKA